jgi:hypothetical protein
MVKSIKLTMSDDLFKRIHKEKTMFGYMHIQEVINEILRDRLLRRSAKNKTKAGRPRKMDETKLITRHDKIFSNKGVPIQI